MNAVAAQLARGHDQRDGFRLIQIALDAQSRVSIRITSIPRSLARLKTRILRVKAIQQLRQRCIIKLQLSHC
jgi:hypothetical protein